MRQEYLVLLTKNNSMQRRINYVVNPKFLRNLIYSQQFLGVKGSVPLRFDRTDAIRDSRQSFQLGPRQY
jgi:hypothetical protein